jgi:hypothetical protein
MKLGVVVNDVLNQLSQQTWQDASEGNYRRLKTTISPDVSEAVEALIIPGLKYLKKIDMYASTIKIDFNSTDSMLGIFYPGTQNLPEPIDFIKDVKRAINDYVKTIASNWLEIQLSRDEVCMPGYFFLLLLKGKWVSMGHATIEDAYPLLKILGKQIPENDLFVAFSVKQLVLMGKKELVTDFINNISVNLSLPCENATIKPNITSLTNQCLKLVHRYALFQPNVFSLDKLNDYGVPAGLREQIKEKYSQLEHIQDCAALEKYEGKVVICKTSDMYRPSNKGWKVFPETPELKVGIITYDFRFFDEENVDNAKILLFSPEMDYVYFNPILSKYIDLHLRLPLPEELEKIKEVLTNRKEEFEFGGGIFGAKTALAFTLAIMRVIDQQKLATEQLFKEDITAAKQKQLTM